MARAAEPRFCVVGAGAAGLSAADALRRLGHQKVTVLEKDAERVGGKCRTAQFDGATVDTGAIYVLPNYPLVLRRVRQAHVTLQRASRFVHVGADGRIRPFGEPPNPISFTAKLAEYGRLGLEIVEHREVFSRPLGEVSPEVARALSLPFARWVEEHRLRFFHEAAYPLLRSFGFGFEEQEIPAIYVFKVLPQLARGGNLASLWDVSSVDLYQIREGYGELWKRVAARLDVRLGVEVRSITRSSGVVRVRTAEEDLEFDRLILACPLDEALSFLDGSPEERRLFGRVRWLHVWQASARVEGVPDAALIDRNHSFSRIGRPMILLRYDPGANLYYVFGYATEAMDGASIEASIAEDVASIGGRVVAPPVLRRWKYFPHYASADVAAGCLADLERLQGQQDTWYVGELVSGIGVESVSTYAERLVERVWGGERR